MPRFNPDPELNYTPANPTAYALSQPLPKHAGNDAATLSGMKKKETDAQNKQGASKQAQAQSVPYNKNTKSTQTSAGTSNKTQETFAHSPEVLNQMLVNKDHIVNNSETFNLLKKTDQDIQYLMDSIKSVPGPREGLISPAIADYWANQWDTRDRFTDSNVATKMYQAKNQGVMSQKDKIEALGKLSSYRANLANTMHAAEKSAFDSQLKNKAISGEELNKVMQQAYESGTKVGSGAGGLTPWQIHQIGRQIETDEGKKKTRMEDYLIRLGDKSKIGDATGVKDTLYDISGILTKYDDIPGWGSDWYNRLFKSPGMSQAALAKMPGYKELTDVQKNDVIKLNNIIGKMNAKYRKYISGVASSSKEAALLSKLVGESPFTTDDELRTALGNLASEMSSNLMGVSKSYPEDVQEEFWKKHEWHPDQLLEIQFRPDGSSVIGPPGGGTAQPSQEELDSFFEGISKPKG